MVIVNSRQFKEDGDRIKSRAQSTHGTVVSMSPVVDDVSWLLS